MVKKYTLHKTDDGDGPAPCAFFLSPKGCNNGDNCKFAHILPSAAKAAQSGSLVPVASSNNSVSSSDISSESEDEAPPAPVAPKAKIPKAKTPKAKTLKATTPKASTPKITTPKAKPQTVLDADGMFAAPGERDQTPKSDKKRKKRTIEQTDPFSKPKHTATAATTPQATPATTSTPKSKKRAKVVEKQSSFRDLDLPVASFSVPGAFSAMANLPISTPPTAAPPQPPKFPVPASTPEGIKWQNVVIATRKNPRYQADFDFDKVRKQLLESKESGLSNWVKAMPYGPWCTSNPHAIAIDCEMCETKDPISGVSNHKALCRLSVVNAVNPDEVLLDTLVKPEWPVVDHRSRINGIKKDHLEGVQFTLQHAQAFMTALCSNETVIIGHAVHNDLVALQMEHHCNADSAMLFSVKDELNATCSLKDLAKQVLKREMPDVHDSVNDARVALFVLEEGYLKTDGKPEPIIRTVRAKRNGGNNDLFVHRIPKGCIPEHISNMFLAHTHIKPKEVPNIEFNSDTGKTIVSFVSADHANSAFKTLDGEAKPDKTGRFQKRLYLKTGGYINVRQMTAPKKAVNK
jgi:hypothetical protein